VYRVILTCDYIVSSMVFFVEEPEDGLIWSEFVYQLGRPHYLIKIVV